MIISFAAAVLMIAVVWCAFFRGLTVSHYTISNEFAPEGFRIVQISDLHNERFGENQHKLFEKIKNLQPDIVVFTGDMFDRANNSLAETEELATALRDEDYPVYAVTGNHEKWHPASREINAMYDRVGVIRLENTYTEIEFRGKTVRLCGISDPDMWSETMNDPSILRKGLENAPPSPHAYNILLFHRANLFEHLNDKGYNLILSGHIHGGIVRLPFVGGVASPYGNYFPKYDAGKYEENRTVMIVSRGLGNSGGLSVPRIFNPPDICFIEFNEIKE